MSEISSEQKLNEINSNSTEFTDEMRRQRLQILLEWSQTFQRKALDQIFLTSIIESFVSYPDDELLKLGAEILAFPIREGGIIDHGNDKIVDDRLQSALDQFGDKRYGESINICSKVIKTDPRNEVAWSILVDSLYLEHKFKEAEFAARMLLEIDESLKCYDTLSRTQIELGKFKEAESTLRIAMQKFGDAYQLKFDMGRVLIKLSRFNEALDELITAKKLLGAVGIQDQARRVLIDYHIQLCRERTG